LPSLTFLFNVARQTYNCELWKGAVAWVPLNKENPGKPQVVKTEVGIKCPDAFNISFQGFPYPRPMSRWVHKTKSTFYFAPDPSFLSSLTQIQLDVSPRTLMVHELRNSINREEKENQISKKQLVFKLRISSLSSLPFLIDVNLTSLALNIPHPSYVWQESTASEQKICSRHFSRCFLSFPLFKAPCNTLIHEQNCHCPLGSLFAGI
jgi:hypothetical protein